MKGPLIVLSGPAGSGKSTIVRRLLADKSLPLRLSVSATTRPPRPGERGGVDYHFWTRECFQEAIRRGEFLEWADVFGNLYGTPRSEVEPFREKGVGVLLEIDVQGWDQIRQVCPDAVSIFLRTSSMETYEQRLRDRRTENEEAMKRRLAGAQRELAQASQYRHQIINDKLETAVAEIASIVRSHINH